MSADPPASKDGVDGGSPKAARAVVGASPIAMSIADEAGKTAPGSPSHEQELSDTEAVERAREGDHEAFRVLVERYQARVFRLALRILRDEEQARDAIQDAFLKVYGSLRRFEGRSSFYTWLYRLVFNQCLDLKRKDKSSRHVEWEEERIGEESVLDTASGAVGAGGLPGPGSEFERGELREMMAKAIETLPDDARETLVLREIEGLAYTEIAATLGIPKGTVMSRLHYARKKVQEALLEAGVTPPGSGKSRKRKGGGS